MPVVAVRNLVKDYGPSRAVDGISFAIEPGEVFGLLGENGAGKSTTVEILEGHRERTAGDVTVLGEDPGSASRSFRDRIGIVLQTSGVEPVLTVRELVTLGALVAWGLVGVLLAWRSFKWEPVTDVARRGAPGRQRRRRQRGRQPSQRLGRPDTPGG